MLNTLRAQLELHSTPKAASVTAASPRAQETRLHQHLAIFLVLLLLLPQKASFLVTWVRNLASVGITTPKTTAAWMDHNVLDVAPVVVLVWLMAGGRRLEPPRSGLEAKAVAAGFLVSLAGMRWCGASGTPTERTMRSTRCVRCSPFASGGRGVEAARAGHNRSSRAEGKNSDETLGMLDDQDGAEGSSISKLGIGRQAEAYELTARSDSERLPIHHLALPASLASFQDAAAADPVEREPDPQSDAAQPSTSTSGDRLDTLIGQYLDVLDRYQQARSASCESFSRGYLKLSRAKMEYGASRLSSNSYDSRLLGEIRAHVEPGSSKLTGAATSAEPEPKRILAERFVPDYSHLSEAQDGAEAVLLGLTDEKEGQGTATKQENAASGLRRRAGPVSPAGQDAADGKEGRVSLPSSSLGTQSANSTARQDRPGRRRARPAKITKRGCRMRSCSSVGCQRPSLRGAQVDLKRALDQVLGVGAKHTLVGQGLVQLVSQLGLLGKGDRQVAR
ncbi:hypothetical protein L1887_47627 [Cichorium endivia]|nr:hypothetical protein L1887_47627 [Cichorium endivia]